MEYNHTSMEANQISFDAMINNQDILLRACSETFGNDGNITQLLSITINFPSSGATTNNTATAETTVS